MKRLLGQLKGLNLTGLKTVLLWEFRVEFSRGLNDLAWFVQLIALGGILLGLKRAMGPGFSDSLVPGVFAALMLHPFLMVGQTYLRGSIPQRWKSLPQSPLVYSMAGVVPRLIRNCVGVLVLAVMLSVDGIQAGFILSWKFLTLWILMIPFGLGWGGLTASVSSLFSTPSVSCGAVKRISEWLGGVFFSPVVLPLWLKPFSLLFPHAYLAELGRDLNSEPIHQSYYYGGGIFLSSVFFVVGLACLIMIVDRVQQTGVMDRST